MVRRLVIALLATTLLAGILAVPGGAATRTVVLSARAAHVPVMASCPSTKPSPNPRTMPSPGCRVRIELWATVRPMSRGQVLVGRTTVFVASGEQRPVMVSLTPLGRRLLRRHGPLRLTVRTDTTVLTSPNAPAPPPPVTAPTSPTPPTTPCKPGGPPVAFLPGSGETGVAPAPPAAPGCNHPLGSALAR